MLERSKQKETYLELQEDEESLSVEHLDSQVQKAQEQLFALKRQQEQIEKQKRELEELSRRQEQLQLGKTEMTEKFTRALVVLERESYDAQKRVEQLRGIQEGFLQHVSVLESISPKSWDPEDINKELNKALSAIDDARSEYSRSRVLISPEASEEVTDPAFSSAEYGNGYGAAPQSQDFVYWLKSGFAFTLPLLVIALALLVFLIVHFSNP